MRKNRKWFTCTPIRFKGDHTFFSRDSGLLCKGFKEIGVECKAIMPGPPMENDHPVDLIRTDYKNLEDPEWWRSLGGEGVVFYGWGEGRYWRIARAIKQSGLLFVSHIDASGVISILNGFALYVGIYWRVIMAEKNSFFTGLFCFILRLGYATTAALLQNDFRRALHLRNADIIGAITPIALARINKVLRVYGGEALVSKTHLIPHPNASYMQPSSSIPKERLVIAVGRWDDSKVKGADLLIATTEKVAKSDEHVTIEIYGRATASMEAWHRGLESSIRERIRLMGIVPNRVIMLGLQRAQISICTSLRESYHIVSAEALCCGCSVVGPDVTEAPSMKWFANGDHGRISLRNAESMSAAVIAELEDWDAGRRNPRVISANWSSILHAPRVAEKILDLAIRKP